MAGTAHAGQPFQLQTHWSSGASARDFEAGNYAQGVERLEARLASGVPSGRQRSILLIDLCAGYIMLHRLDDAVKACDAAISAGWYRNMALNNRGIANMVRGRHSAAVLDFQAAIAALRIDSRVPRANWRQAETRIAEIQRQREQVMLAGRSDVNDVSTVSLRKTNPRR